MLRIPWLSDRLDETRDAYEVFRGYMLEIVGGARDKYVSRAGKGTGLGKGEDAALLRNLVRANMEEAGGGNGRDRDVEGKDREGAGLKGLTDDELLSNVFVSLARQIVVVGLQALIVGASAAGRRFS